MTDSRLWAKMDVQYFSNPKIAEIIDCGSHADRIHVASILYCRQHLTDGFVSEAAVIRSVGGTTEEADLLVRLGLWHRPGHGCEECPEVKDAGRVFVHDYPRHNEVRDDVERRSKAARTAVSARWSDTSRIRAVSESHSVEDTERNADSIQSKSKSKNKNKNTIAADAASEFDAFWAVYPRKEGKLAAQRAYVKARSLTTAEQILSAVEAYTRRSSDPRFIAHPATWLNQGRWDDVPAVESQSAQQPFDFMNEPW